MELATLAGGLLAGYMVGNQAPRQDPNKKGASIFVLACIDPRYADNLAWYLTHHSALRDDYDLVCFAGASLGVIQNDFPSWRQTFVDHVNLGLQLHDVKEVWCFDHLDCGMYKATLGLEKDNDVGIHVQTQNEFANFLAETFPTLGFKGFIIDTAGRIEQII